MSNQINVDLNGNRFYSKVRPVTYGSSVSVTIPASSIYRIPLDLPLIAPVNEMVTLSTEDTFIVNDPGIYSLTLYVEAGYTTPMNDAHLFAMTINQIYADGTLHRMISKDVFQPKLTTGPDAVGITTISTVGYFDSGDKFFANINNRSGEALNLYGNGTILTYSKIY
jgi:hypothetical protein